MSPAPIGNKFWEARTKHGRNKLFESPEALWEACIEYFEWVEENPLIEAKVFHAQGKITTAELPKMRAMTIDGLCLFLDIDDCTWQRWRGEDDFKGVVAKADKVIRSQKFAGAAADLLNSNIIARDLGLAEKHSVGGASDLPPIQTQNSTLSKDEALALLAKNGIK